MKMLSAWFNTYLWAVRRGGLRGGGVGLPWSNLVTNVVLVLILGGSLPVSSQAQNSEAADKSTTDKTTQSSAATTPKGKAAAAELSTDKSKEDKEKAKKKKKKEKSTISLHLETNPDPSGRSMEVTVLRSTPMQVTIFKEPMVTENHLIAAKLIEEVGGSFMIELQFDSTGRLLLENYSASQRGKRIVVFSDFGQKRFIGVKKITTLISDGRFTFSPDASKEEAERIMNGLERVAKDNVKRDKW